MLTPDGTRAAVLRELFGDTRAEWPPERFGDLFIEPNYFAKLQSRRSSFLVGGRGTGKTTALRSLRFDVTYDRHISRGGVGSVPGFLGIYIRINKNRVAAFQGPALSPEAWRKAFAHYFNLMVAAELVRLAMWLETTGSAALGSDPVRQIAKDLAVGPCATLRDLQAEIAAKISDLQLYVNNPHSIAPPLLSLSDAPLKTFAFALEKSGSLEDRTLFCCVDEYENLLTEQQAVLNTYIKHSEPPLAYKIGVKSSGLRTRHTLDDTDHLRVPDDYGEIVIAEEGFNLFATAVAALRLKRAAERGADVPSDLDAFLETLSFEDEARLLGAADAAGQARALLRHSGDRAVVSWLDTATDAQLFFLSYWRANDPSLSLEALAQDWIEHPDAWRNRLNNYGYSSLFWLSKGRKGARIRKYYSGASTILSLAAGNIRYFLELLDEAVAGMLERPTPLPKPFVVSAKAQTEAARTVGRRRLDQLEGLAHRGVELKRLVLAVGKVFFELARNPIGHAPEVTSFVVSGTGADRARVDELLREGVAHLALEETPRTKATSNAEIRDSEYRLHPIFCAFFEISHRRKRRATFKSEDLLAISTHPSRAIARLLEEIEQSPEDELPEQLAFFGDFFAGESAGSEA
ncbi:ORC-CDC6 family AAA ATPase [Luteitalea sp.]